jgi:hypothetical protein
MDRSSVSAGQGMLLDHDHVAGRSQSHRRIDPICDACVMDAREATVYSGECPQPDDPVPSEMWLEFA